MESRWGRHSGNRGYQCRPASPASHACQSPLSPQQVKTHHSPRLTPAFGQTESGSLPGLHRTHMPQPRPGAEDAGKGSILVPAGTAVYVPHPGHTGPGLSPRRAPCLLREASVKCTCGSGILLAAQVALQFFEGSSARSHDSRGPSKVFPHVCPLVLGVKPKRKTWDLSFPR